MLTIFLDFLSKLALKVFDTYSFHEHKSNKALHKLFDFYSNLCRIHECLEKFSECLVVWKQHGYHGSDWSMCQNCIRQINIAFQLINYDLRAIIELADLGLGRELYGYIHTKISVFGIWTELVERNAKENFCGWKSDYSGQTWNKTIFIPDYSLIISDVRRTSELADLSSSVWNSPYLSIDGVDRSLLNCLPELPVATEICADNVSVPSYCKIVVVPDEEREIDKIINLTQERANDLHKMLKELSQLLLKFAGGDASRFLRYT
jgi:hypothetical protein